jgi:hypothetical protein
MKLGLVAAFLALGVCRPAADPVRGLHYTSHAAPVVNTLHVPVWYDSRLPEPMQYALRDALGEWNYVFNGYRVYELQAPEDGGNDALEWRVENQRMMLYVKAAFVHDLDYPSDGVLGWVDTEDQPNVVHVLADGLNVTADAMKTVIMHEIGHSLGLDHTKHNGLLFPYYNEQPTCIDHLTVQELAASFEWDDRHMNWCE